MTAAGVNIDYTLMGGQWDNTKPVSFSFVPDGVAWDQGNNNLNATLNSQFAGADWKTTIATALQTWAASANIDFTTAADAPYGFNTSGLGQGDPRFGDIRIAGDVFPTTTIAQTYGPPPNGATAAGDATFNTAYNFGPNGQWDLESVAIHELGHSLGLGESPQPSSMMYTYYSGVRHALSAYDIEGIQSIYGPRVADLFQAKGQATSAASAVDLSSTLNRSGYAVVNGLSLDSIGDSEYFSVTTPSTSGATLYINAVANGHSLMSPKLTVIDAATGASLAVDSHPDQYGNTATVSVPNVLAGHRYLIVVTGSAQNVFSVGNYSLQAAYSGGTPPITTTSPTTTTTTTPSTTSTTTTTPVVPVLPVISLPPAATQITAPVSTTPVPTTIATAAPITVTDLYSNNTSFGTAAELGSIAGQSMIRNVTLRSGQDIRVFAFEPASSGLVFLASANTTLLVGDSSGRFVASGRGLVGFVAPQAGTRYFVVVLSPNNAAVADASFAIQVVPMATATQATTTTSTTVMIGQATPTGVATTTRTSKAKKRHR